MNSTAPTNPLAKAIRLRPAVGPVPVDASHDRERWWGDELFAIAARLSLTEAQYDAIEAHYDALQGMLSNADDPRLANAHIFVQGSIRARTAILPHPDATGEHAEVDADAVVWLPRAGESASALYDALEKRLRAAARTKRQPSRKKRCVRLHYQDDNPPFHMDVTPARNAPGNLNEKGSGALQVPDIDAGQWKPSAPADFAEWLEKACEAELLTDRVEMRRLEERERLAKTTQEPLPDHESYLDFNPLRAAIKLLKAHRDAMFLDPSIRDLRPISIVLTTLAAHAYVQIAAESQVVPRRPADVLQEIVIRMPKFIEGAPGRRIVRNPVIASENFAEKWWGPDGALLENAFYEWHREALVAVRLGLHAFPNLAALSEQVVRAFGKRAVRNTEVTAAALPKAVGVIPIVEERGPKERFIHEMFPIRQQFELEIDCEEKKGERIVGSLRRRSRLNPWLPYGRKLRFYVSRTTVPGAYTLYWKVRNVGPAATRLGQIRGEIVKDDGSQSREERSSFTGAHYVEAYAVKDGVCVAMARLDVPIGYR